MRASSSARRSAACSPSDYGITAPFWFGFIGSALLVIVLWRQFDNIAHAGDAKGPQAGDELVPGAADL